MKRLLAVLLSAAIMAGVCCFEVNAVPDSDYVPLSSDTHTAFNDKIVETNYCYTYAQENDELIVCLYYGPDAITFDEVHQIVYERTGWTYDDMQEYSFRESNNFEGEDISDEEKLEIKEKINNYIIVEREVNNEATESNAKPFFDYMDIDLEYYISSSVIKYRGEPVSMDYSGVMMCLTKSEVNKAYQMDYITKIDCFRKKGGIAATKISEPLQQIMSATPNDEKIDVYLEIEPAIKYDGAYSIALERRVLKEMGLTSVPSWRDDPEGHRQFEALRYSMLMEDYNKNAMDLLELLDVSEEDNVTPTGVTMYWHWRLTVSQINLANEQDCVIKMQATEFDLDDDEEPDLEAEIQYQNKFEEWSVNKFEEECLSEGYYYDELYIHYNEHEPDWVLVEARYYSLTEPAEPTWLHVGGIGGRTVFAPSIGNCFLTGYGIYDVNDNQFYGFEQFADNDCTIFTTEFEKLPFDASKYDGLIDALEELNIGYVTGDANGDNKVDILDATFIQKAASGKANIDYAYRYILDVNNDYTVDILDATAIQKLLVE